MNKPLEIRDVENISLEASDDNSDMYPQLVAQFACHHAAKSDCIPLVFEHFFERHLYISMLFSCLDDQCDTCCY